MADTGITVEALKTQLAAVFKSITDILLTGRSYVRPGLTLTRESLDSLQQREIYLVNAIKRATDGMIAAGEVATPQGSGGDASWDGEGV